MRLRPALRCGSRHHDSIRSASKASPCRQWDRRNTASAEQAPRRHAAGTDINARFVVVLASLGSSPGAASGPARSSSAGWPSASAMPAHRRGRTLRTSQSPAGGTSLGPHEQLRTTRRACATRIGAVTRPRCGSPSQCRRSDMSSCRTCARLTTPRQTLRHHHDRWRGMPIPRACRFVPKLGPAAGQTCRSANAMAIHLTPPESGPARRPARDPSRASRHAASSIA